MNPIEVCTSVCVQGFEGVSVYVCERGIIKCPLQWFIDQFYSSIPPPSLHISVAASLPNNVHITKQISYTA